MRDLLIPFNKDGKKSGKTKYKSLADGLRLAIREGKIHPGENLPSTRDLARRFRMHRHTVMAALGELEAEGWITPKAKRFYQVTETLPDTFLKPKFLMSNPQSVSRSEFRFVRPVDLADFCEPSGIKHSFPSGFPDLRLFPMREFKSYVYDALRSKNVLDYGNPTGHPELIRAVEEYLRRVRAVTDREIIITNGSQEAIFLLAQMLIAPGDAVAVEALGYPPARQALQFAGAKLLPIPVDEEGLDVAELEKKLSRHKIRFLYMTPLHQYPTTVTLSASRRLQLYELAVRNNILILEDDYDHEFHYVSQPVAPLASFDPAGIILYVSTFSKILFPSARVGFMAVPKSIGRQVAKLKRISSRQNEQILQVAIANWLRSGGFEKHLRKMRRTYEERRNAILADLTEIKKFRPGLSWVEPDGGMALWLNLGQDSGTFAAAARKNSILLNPEAKFHLEGRGGTHLRIGFSGFTPVENRAALLATFAVKSRN